MQKTIRRPDVQHPSLSYRLTFQIGQMDLVAIHDYLTCSYWSKGIPFSVVEKAFSNSIAIGLITKDGETVGAARMVTDGATFAYLADVYILEAHRGKRLAPWMVGALMDHPELQGLRRIMLATSDMHPLYRKFGFKSLDKPEIMMEIVQPDIYLTDEEK